ncbi:hypothetical protein ZOSMA_45G00110 [Zostera marina]|uniref:Uncharacterized protein n=1 Tax=Zostera marina TaxID=29655 RepID=A0A0K9P0G4_ZOSMR|nr:hypothetical protein ZOSMA_45G00110 [Zostera marina]
MLTISTAATRFLKQNHYYLSNLLIFNLQQTYITPTESKMYVDGSTSNDAASQCLSLPSFNSDENTVVVSYPVVIHNSPEFWDVAIQSAEDRDCYI